MWGDMVARSVIIKDVSVTWKADVFEFHENRKMQLENHSSSSLYLVKPLCRISLQSLHI